MFSVKINYLVIVGTGLKRQASKRGSNTNLYQSLSSNFKNIYGECPTTVLPTDIFLKQYNIA
jgi:hypothetical protein